MRTQEEIEKQIEALKEVRPKIRPTTAFGDDNLAALDAQLNVLEDCLDEDDIWDRWPKDEEDIHTREAALEAYRWTINESEADDLAKDQPLA